MLVDTQVKSRHMKTLCSDAVEVNSGHRHDQIGLLRFMNKVVQMVDPKQNNCASKLAFRFLDYDNSGTIGSVDILNLKESFEEEELERIYKLFYDAHVKEELGVKLSKLFTKKISDKLGSGFNAAKKGSANLSSLLNAT